MRTILVAALLLGTVALADTKPVTVTPDSFCRAETDMYFANSVKDAGGVGKLFHRREVISVDRQPVVRPNRDTLYSSGVFDLDAAPVTITMPDAGTRFMSLMAIDEDHYVAGVWYGKGPHTFTRKGVGTRYMLIGIRTFIDPNDPKDADRVHALQDAIRVQQAKAGTLEVPTWDAASQKKVREALLLLNETMPDSKRAFGAKGQVDPVRHLIGTAMGWGGNPEKEAFYLPVTPARNDGTTVHVVQVRDVPVDAFWSITVYNRDGYMEPNPQNAYSLNDRSATKNADGSFTIRFGGCDGNAPNCLPITKGWNYLVRLYRPRPEVLNGTWKFPEAKPLS